MTEKRKRSASVKFQGEVVIPQRLLSVSKRGGNEWALVSEQTHSRHRRQNSQPHNEAGHGAAEEDNNCYGTVQQILDEYRRQSLVSSSNTKKRASLQNARPGGRRRNNSAPVTFADGSRPPPLHQHVYVDRRPSKRDDEVVKAGMMIYDRETGPFTPSDMHSGSAPRPQLHPQYSYSLALRNGHPHASAAETPSSSSEDFPIEVDYQPQPLNVPRRKSTVKKIVHAIVPDVVQETARNVIGQARRNSMYDLYEKAKERGVELQRKRWAEVLFECAVYTILICFIYFVMIGMPLWEGAVYWMYRVISTKFVIAGGWSITVAIAAFYSFSPLLILFEEEPPLIDRPNDFDRNSIPGVDNTALLIPCYKSASLIGATLKAAVKIFPPSHIFVIANGNSETPLDNTEEVCIPFGVNHIWCPVGSKIVAQFVGSYAAKGFRNVLLIDDDCALPPNFPVVSDRLTHNVRSIGYTIKSVGPNSSKGTWCQQAQDLEYKISGLQRALAGKVGSATFPHGAISLWSRTFLIKTFHDHPGFSVSEDWFFGHSCRRLGGRIKMCSSVFVETETPPAVFFSSGGSRGGFGEMTVFKQRFLRWNFFFVNGMYYNMHYIFTSWKLGWWEIGAKIFVFQEVYETLLYLLTPIVLPISFVVAPSFCGYLTAGTVALYLANVVIFNEVHLRLRNERISWLVLVVYYMPYKLLLTLVNVASCYWSLYKYARYFAKRHPKVIEDEKAVGVVLRLDEVTPATKEDTIYEEEEGGNGRRMTVTAVAKQSSVGSSTKAGKRMSARVSFIGPGSPTDLNKRMSFVLGSDDIQLIDSPCSSSTFSPAGPPLVSPPPPIAGSRSPHAYGLTSPSLRRDNRGSGYHDPSWPGVGRRPDEWRPYKPAQTGVPGNLRSPYDWLQPGSGGSNNIMPVSPGSTGNGSELPPAVGLEFPKVTEASKGKTVRFSDSIDKEAGPSSIYARRRKSSWSYNPV